MSLWKAEQFRPAERENTSQPETAIPEWLDRYPWLPILFLILLPFLVELPLLIFGLSTNPIWFDSGIVYGTHNGLLPGLPYIDPNVGFTTQALGHLAAKDWLHGIIPWWNPYSGIGLPLAGEMQPNAFFLPFVFLLLLHNGVLWLKIAMQVFSGLATFALLRELKLGRLAALTGGALYALNGTFAWLPGVLGNTIPFLPLLLFGIERTRKEHNRDGIIWIALAISGSLYAGFPEAAYINGLLALGWTFYRFPRELRRWHFLERVIYGGALGLLISAPLIVAFVDYLLTTNTLTSHAFGSAFLPIKALSSLFLPYVYGPIFHTAGSSILNDVWDSVGGYTGALLIFFAVIGVISTGPERGLRWLLFAWILIAWAKTFGFTPVMDVMNHIPLLRDVAFDRYSPPSWEMALAILAAMAIDDIKQGMLRDNMVILTLVAIVTTLALAAYVAWPWATMWQWPESQVERMVVLLAVAMAWAVSGLLFVIFVWFCMHNEQKRWMLAMVLLMDTAVLFIVPELSGTHAGKIDHSAIKFLHSNLGESRFYTLGPIEPNYGAYFNIATINHNYLPIPLNWTAYISHKLLPSIPKNGVTFWAPAYGENVGIDAFDKMFVNYKRLSVRYVVTNKGQSLLPSINFPTNTSGNTPLVLGNNATAIVKFNIPANVKNNTLVSSVSVLQGNYGDTANGNLTVKVCTSSNDCSIGGRSLTQSSDNSSFSISLEGSLQVKAGEPITITFTHLDSTRPEAFWLWPQAPGHEQTVIGPQGPIPGKAIQFSLETSDTALQGLRKVYSDALLDIWELPHPAPYYTVMHGDCQISNPTRDGLVAQCSTSATLLRRELYMPGWTASVNGVSAAVSAHEKIFQTISLSAGKNVIRFRFAPPYVNYAWIAFYLGILGMIIQLTLPYCRRHKLIHENS